MISLERLLMLGVVMSMLCSLGVIGKPGLTLICVLFYTAVMGLCLFWERCVLPLHRRLEKLEADRAGADDASV